MEEPTAKNKSKAKKTKGDGGGSSGFFRRMWYTLKFFLIGLKWSTIELFTFHKKFDLKKVPRRPGDIAVITGGARGIGLEVIRKLLILDMHVIIGCRNEASGLEMIEKFRKSGINTGSTEVISLDLMSLESVRDFGNAVLAKYSKIHVLINNAGIMAVPYNLTKDGYESQFQVNYLSHFLLTNILLPKLIKAGRPGKTSRVVNVSSVAHYGGIINFEDLNMQQMYSAEMGYMASKLMQVVSTRDLDSRLAKEGVHLKVYAVHPGVVKTDLYDSLCLARIFGFMLKLIYKTPEQGADGVVFTAISSKFEGDGGLFFANGKKNSVNKLAKDPAIQKHLLDISCQLTQWEDIPISELVKQTLASRGTKSSTKNEISNPAKIPKIDNTRKSETESIKRALEPMKFIDDLDLEDIDEQDIQDIPDVSENSQRLSSLSGSSSSISLKSLSDNEPPRSSISSKSSTATVIAGTPICETNPGPGSDFAEGVQMEDNQIPHTITGPERDLLVDIGIVPHDEGQDTVPVANYVELHDSSDIIIEDGHSSLRSNKLSLTSTCNYVTEGEQTSISQAYEHKTVSMSNGHESTSSSFVYEST